MYETEQKRNNVAYYYSSLPVTLDYFTKCLQKEVNFHFIVKEACATEIYASCKKSTCLNELYG
jgi:hypothetical protein